MDSERPAVPLGPVAVSFLIRAGGIDDLDAVGELHALSRSRTYSWGYHPEPLKTQWHQRFALEHETHRLLVAVSDGVLIGFTYAGDGVLHAIHVHPDWHGKGVGSVLMRGARQALRQLGSREAVLWVVEGNDRACHFYEKDGWQRSGRMRESELDGVVTRQFEYVTALG